MDGIGLMAPADGQIPGSLRGDMASPAANASLENGSPTSTSPLQPDQEVYLSSGLQLRISGLDNPWFSVIIDNGIGEPDVLHGRTSEDILREIPDDCREIVLCIDTQRWNSVDGADVLTANIAIEVVESLNGTSRTAAALDKDELDRFFRVQRQHALHPMDPAHDIGGQIHYKWGALRTQDRVRNDLEIARFKGYNGTTSPALRPLLQDSRFIHCWRSTCGSRRYRPLSLNSCVGRDHTASYIEDQAVSVWATRLHGIRFSKHFDSNPPGLLTHGIS